MIMPKFRQPQKIGELDGGGGGDAKSAFSRSQPDGSRSGSEHAADPSVLSHISDDGC